LNGENAVQYGEQTGPYDQPKANAHLVPSLTLRSQDYVLIDWGWPPIWPQRCVKAARASTGPRHVAGKLAESEFKINRKFSVSAAASAGAEAIAH
jgi:hypothetical protein